MERHTDCHANVIRRPLAGFKECSPVRRCVFIWPDFGRIEATFIWRFYSEKSHVSRYSYNPLIINAIYFKKKTISINPKKN
jgi:hypothetical protein